MLKIDIICVSKCKRGPYAELIDMYKKRIRYDLKLIEIEAKNTDPEKANIEESEKILKSLSSQAYIIALDERGVGLKSLDFSKSLEKLVNSGETHLQFILGGADGLTNEIRDKANLLLGFGQQTWPHLLARVMLLEQLYRAQQIQAGHPYHRE